MSIEERATDPRTQRTHQLLKQALASLLDEKDIRKITVQDITERAKVNRATFYAHFEDKYALIEDWFREEFQRILMSKLPATSTLNMKSLHALILTVFIFFEGIRSYCETPGNMSLKEFKEFFMAVIQREITTILSTWFKQLPLSQQQVLEPLDVTARVTCWTILGPAIQWGGEADPLPVEKIAHQVTLIATRSLSNLTLLP